MNKMIKTAIIPVGGYGTRRLPASKALEKCMLCIGNRPGVDYIIEDCERAGIERIIFVVHWIDNGDQLRAYINNRFDLEEYLEKGGKTEELKKIRSTSRGIKIDYVVQDPKYGYGTAIPVWQCTDLIKDEEAVAVLMGDDIVYRRDGGSDVKDLIAALNKSDAEHGMLTTEIPHEDVSKYGVLVLEGDYLSGFAEKPSIETAPSNLINISKYIFKQSFFKDLDEYMKLPLPDGRERYITDVIESSVKKGDKILVQKIKGVYLDNGDEQGALRAWKVIVGGEDL